MRRIEPNSAARLVDALSRHSWRLAHFETSVPRRNSALRLINGAYAVGGDRCHRTCARRKNGYQKSAKNSRSGICEAFNPVQGPNNVGIAPEIIIAR